MRAAQAKRLRGIAKRATQRDDKAGYSRFYKAMKRVFKANGQTGANKQTGRGVILAFEQTIKK